MRDDIGGGCFLLVWVCLICLIGWIVAMCVPLILAAR